MHNNQPPFDKGEDIIPDLAHSNKIDDNLKTLNEHYRVHVIRRGDNGGDIGDVKELYFHDHDGSFPHVWGLVYDYRRKEYGEQVRQCTKLPVTVNFLKWTGHNHRTMYDFLTNGENANSEIRMSGDNFYIDHSKVEGGLIIKTLEGEHLAKIGDHIIKGVNGEFYPCKENIFDATYKVIYDGTNEVNV
jgi:hypothetical protein